MSSFVDIKGGKLDADTLSDSVFRQAIAIGVNSLIDNGQLKIEEVREGYYKASYLEETMKRVASPKQAKQSRKA